jgi:hypothetical protein
MLELHCHTTCSDGSLTPTELVEAAAAAGVKALAITDHDTLAGWDEAFAAAAQHGLEVVPGLELSTVLNGRSLHVLGFYPDRDALQDCLNYRLEDRKCRARKILDKLAALGYPVELSEAEMGMSPGRPHIAAAMVQAGYVDYAHEAFDRFLAEDRPAYVPYEKFASIDGIAVLRRCHAVPVWAHPYLFMGGNVEAVLPDLVAAGLMGIEVFRPDHTPAQVHQLQTLCTQYGLIMTGGSDYHGPGTRSTTEDWNLNGQHLPLSLLEILKQAAAVA